MNKNESKKLKITSIFMMITLLFIILIGAFIHINTSDKKLPQLKISEDDKAIRGDILSRNNFTLSTSKKLYKATIDTRNIHPDKATLFVTLFSIFSNIPKEEIKEKLLSKYGFVTLSYKLDSKSARYIKQLTRKLYKMGVFVKYTDEESGNTFFHGLNITESGEYRVYPLNDTLTPVIGFVRKKEKDGYTNIVGKYGLESYYEDKLAGIQSTRIVGRRDIRNNIIFDNNSKVKNRVDGYDIVTSISIKLQKELESILDRQKQRTEAKEIIASVMDSKTGDILAIASSRRVEPANKRKNGDHLTISAIRYLFEPGSVMKPIVLSLLLDERNVAVDDIVRTYNGRFKLGKKIITDEHKYEYLSVDNVIVHSSNIGMTVLSQKLDEIDYFQGLRNFGFSKRSGIDLSYELSGSIPNIHQLKNSVIKATASYGYGVKVNFFQLMQAYNVFNNNGYKIQPSIGEFIKSKYSKQKIFNKKSIKVLKPETAKSMNKILIKTVNKGTGKGAITPGLKVGGKTGTAQISVRGRYSQTYNSSFFGFANDDKNHKYTIGVTVIEPNPKGGMRFASQSAVPVFKDIVDTMVKNNFLIIGQ